MACQAEPGALGIALLHLDQLPHDARTHAPGMKARAPVCELGRVASAAASRGQRLLDRGVPGRCGSLRGDRHTPVPREKCRIGSAISGRGSGRGRAAGSHGGDQDDCGEQQYLAMRHEMLTVEPVLLFPVPTRPTGGQAGSSADADAGKGGSDGQRPGSRLVSASTSRSVVDAVSDHGLGCRTTCSRPRWSVTR